jgi:hypothetical protein
MNFKFETGDVVKIDKNYLDVGENPDTEYIVREDFGNGKVEVYLPKPNDIYSFKGIWTWPDYTMYKVRHLNIMPDGVEYYDVGDVLANDKTTVVISDYDIASRLYTVEFTGADAGQRRERTRFELADDGFRRV